MPVTASYTCPRCGHTSHNKMDVQERYCGWCHKFESSVGVTVTATEYIVTALPVKWHEHYDANSWSVRVCWRGPGDKWAVMWMSECYDAQGYHEYESNPSSRTDEFKRLFRFGLDEAIKIAKTIAPKVSINGHNAEAFAKGLEDGTWR